MTEQNGRKEQVLNIVSVIILIAFTIFLGSMLACCTFTKKAASKSSDSTVVSKSAEGGSRMDSSSSKSEKDYERTTYIYPRDTTIIRNNYYRSPEVIIREIGKEKTENNNFDIEQWFKNKNDSLSRHTEEKAVDKKSKTNTLELLLWIAIGIFALEKAAKLLSFLPFKISRR